MISSKECAWAQAELKLLGKTITGIRGFEFKKSTEKEHLFAAGDKPIDIQSGNVKPEGNIKLLKFEVDLLNDAAQAAGYADITEVPHDVVVITAVLRKNANSQARTITATGVSFTEMPMAFEQNAKFMEVTLPFLAMDIRYI